MRVIVIGGGIFGASIAYHTARAGAETVLIDRADQGRATSAGAGIICPWGSRLEREDDYALLEGSARYYPELVAALAETGETDLSYARVGALFAPDNPRALDEIEAVIRSRTARAPEIGAVTRLTADEARDLFPPLRPGLAGLHVAGGARVDGRKVSAAMARAAEHHGARRIVGSATLRREGDRITGVEVEGEAIGADAVVIAAGAWAAALLEPLGLDDGIEPQRGQIVHLRRAGVDTTRWPTVQPVNSYYLLAFDDSRVVVGASCETGAGFDYRLTPAGVAGVLNAALGTAPGLADWTIEEIRIGFRPLPRDGRPVLGPAPGIDGLYLANGLGPVGLTIAPLGGALLAAEILGETPQLQLDSFHPRS